MEEIDKYSKSNPFKVPDGYFNDFQNKLMDKIEKSENKSASSWKIISIKPFLAIAAGFLLIFSLWFFLMKNVEPKQNLAKENNEDYPELKYFELVDSNELIDLVLNNESSSQTLDVNIDEDESVLIEQIEESTILDAI